MNKKTIIAGISAVAALLAAIAAFMPSEPTSQQTATGNQSIQVNGNQNSITK